MGPEGGARRGSRFLPKVLGSQFSSSLPQKASAHTPKTAEPAATPTSLRHVGAVRCRGAWPTRSQSERGVCRRRRDPAAPMRRREPIAAQEGEAVCHLGSGELLSAFPRYSARGVDGTMKASEDGRAEAEFPQMELLESQDSDPEQPQGPGERRQPGSLQSSLSEEAGGSARNLPDEKKPPPPRPGPLAMPPLSLGYGAFRRLGSASREPPSPGAAWAEQPRDGEAATGAEQEPWAAPGEQPSGSWAPMELQVDVRVKPMGAAVGSQAPPPSPSTRFLTVPVPESPASLAHPLSSTEGQGSPLAVGPTERGSDAKGRAVSPGSPTRRCRCKEHELDEEAVQLLRAGWDTKKLPRAMTLIGECSPAPRAPSAG